MVEKQNKGETVMDKVKEKGVFLNPYVMQMDKFADSLIHLSKTFFTLEGYKGALSEDCLLYTSPSPRDTR